MGDVPPGRVRAALTLALGGAISLFGALLAHDLLSFGASGHDMIVEAGASCDMPPCLTMGVVLAGHMAKAVGAGLVFALIGAVWVAGPARGVLGASLWVMQYIWSLIGIASGHRASFGTSWRWWEPFAELMWDPVLTLGLMVGGLLTFWLAVRGLEWRLFKRG